MLFVSVGCCSLTTLCVYTGLLIQISVIYCQQPHSCAGWRNVRMHAARHWDDFEFFSLYLTDFEVLKHIIIPFWSADGQNIFHSVGLTNIDSVSQNMTVVILVCVSRRTCHAFLLTQKSSWMSFERCVRDKVGHFHQKFVETPTFVI